MQLNSLLDRLPNEIADKIMSLATIIGRLRVLGFNLKKELNYNNEGCVFKRISDLVCLAKSRYFLLHLIAKHLTINNETQSAIKQELYYGHNSFGSESFDNKIRETQINLEAIYYDQNECNIQKLCDFMNSLKDDISTRREKTIVDFKFEIREHPIKIPDDEGMGEEFLNSAKYAKSYITSIRDCFSDKMGLLLSSHCIIDNQKTSNEFLINPGLFMVINENVFVKRAHDFDQMVNVIKEMIETEEEPNIHIATQIGTFPLILLMENAKKVKLNCGEFLSCDNIVLGEDVSFMATNTMANKEKLQAYIDSHNLNVEPCL
ncbi:MAG: hypothetical protein KAG53_12220, partial [Endozoicomonadaceae bacterium]|nr:hypothetical protein [Endozoicomonadaceae bacterium]